MGTCTTFEGAIRITPQVEDGLAMRLNRFFRIRHMQRSTNLLMQMFPDLEDRKPRSLMGDGNFGVDGEFYLSTHLTGFPNQCPGPGKDAIDGITDPRQCSTRPGSCPNLYCDLKLVPAAEGDCSYLGWNGAEKPYSIAAWLEFLAAKLVPLGYNLDGTLSADEECGIRYYEITVKDTCVTETEIERMEDDSDAPYPMSWNPTYTDEWGKAQKHCNGYSGCNED